VQLPGANNVVGMWPAIWTMGNLGRAGYGSTLEGMVRLSNNLPSPTIDRSGLIHPDNDNSGHIHMTPATSVQLQIKQSTGSPSRQCKMETIFTTMFCHIYLDRDCRDVLVTERTIPGQNMQTELMSGDLHRRLTCSRLRWVGNHWVEKFHNLHNLRWTIASFFDRKKSTHLMDSSRSIKDIIGIIRAQIWSLVILQNRVWTGLLATSSNKRHQLWQKLINAVMNSSKNVTPYMHLRYAILKTIFISGYSKHEQYKPGQSYCLGRGNTTFLLNIFLWHRRLRWRSTYLQTRHSIYSHLN